MFFLVPFLFSATGTLSFTPAPDAFGTTKVTVLANDHGGGQETSLPQVFTLTINPVNDRPRFTLAGDVTVLQNSGAASRPGWLTSFSAGPANESAQKLATILISTDNPKLFAKAPAIDVKTGTLTFTPAKGVSGQARVTVRVKDTGGTQYGGLNTSDAQTFVITVSPPTSSAAHDAAMLALLADPSPASR